MPDPLDRRVTDSDLTNVARLARTGQVRPDSVLARASRELLELRQMLRMPDGKLVVEEIAALLEDVNPVVLNARRRYILAVIVEKYAPLMRTIPDLSPRMGRGVREVYQPPPPRKPGVWKKKPPKEKPMSRLGSRLARAKCPTCSKIVACSPPEEDKTVDVFHRHKDRQDERCPGSRMVVDASMLLSGAHRYGVAS